MKVTWQLSKAFKQHEIPVGISVHTGVAYFGTMGTTDGLMNITASGEAVNMAARLCSKAAAGEIILSEQTLKQAGLDGSHLESRSLELKGISELVPVRVLRSSHLDLAL